LANHVTVALPGEPPPQLTRHHSRRRSTTKERRRACAQGFDECLCHVRLSSDGTVSRPSRYFVFLPTLDIADANRSNWTGRQLRRPGKPPKGDLSKSK